MKIPFSRPSVGAAEVRAVARAMRSGHIGGNGAVCRRVQARLAELTGARQVLLTPNATQAMELALLAVGLQPGDEVLMPSFAFVSQANALLVRGAVPVFCEVDPRTLCLDPADAARRIGKRTRMLMPVHYAGVACDLGALQELARAHGLLLFEDAAQAIGSRWNGRHLGTVGEAGCLSFHFTKNISCGEGGALLCNREELGRRAEILQEKGTNRSAFLRGEVDKYTWIDTGGSYLLSDALAAILEAQLDRFEVLQQRRMEIWELYHAELAPLEERGRLQRPHVPAGTTHNAHIYWFLAESPELQERLLSALRAAGIQATFHFQPLHASPYARDVLGLRQSLPVTESAAARLVRLPLHAFVRKRDARRIAGEIRRLVEGA